MSDDEKQRLSPVATKQRRQRLQSVHLGTVPDLSELDGDSARGRSPPRTEGEIRVGDQMRVTKQGTKYDNIVTVVNADWNNGMIKVEMDGVTKSYNAFNLKPVHQKKKRASPTRANRSPYRAPTRMHMEVGENDIDGREEGRKVRYIAIAELTSARTFDRDCQWEFRVPDESESLRRVQLAEEHLKTETWRLSLHGTLKEMHEYYDRMYRDGLKFHCGPGGTLLLNLALNAQSWPGHEGWDMIRHLIDYDPSRADDEYIEDTLMFMPDMEGDDVAASCREGCHSLVDTFRCRGGMRARAKAKAQKLKSGTDMFPEIPLPGVYTGENLLHIFIVNDEPDLVDYVLEHEEITDDQKRRMLTARAHGSFFLPSLMRKLDQYTGRVHRVVNQDSKVYFGEFPYTFAACMGSTRIMAAIWDKAKQLHVDVLFAKDGQGNTPLHMALMYEQQECVNLILDVHCKEYEMEQNKSVNYIDVKAGAKEGHLCAYINDAIHEHNVTIGNTDMMHVPCDCLFRYVEGRYKGTKGRPDRTSVVASHMQAHKKEDASSRCSFLSSFRSCAESCAHTDHRHQPKKTQYHNKATGGYLHYDRKEKRWKINAQSPAGVMIQPSCSVHTESDKPWDKASGEMHGHDWKMEVRLDLQAAVLAWEHWERLSTVQLRACAMMGIDEAAWKGDKASLLAVLDDQDRCTAQIGTAVGFGWGALNKAQLDACQTLGIDEDAWSAWKAKSETVEECLAFTVERPLQREQVGLENIKDPAQEDALVPGSRLIDAKRAMLETMNLEGFTPLIFCVRHKKIDMYEHMLGKMTRNLWKYGNVTELNTIPLDQIDTFRRKPDPDVADETGWEFGLHTHPDTQFRSHIEVILDHQIYAFADEKHFRDALVYKWNTFAFNAYLLYFLSYVLSVVCFMAIALTPPQTVEANPVLHYLMRGYFYISVGGLGTTAMIKLYWMISGKIVIDLDETNDISWDEVSTFIHANLSMLLNNAIFCITVIRVGFIDNDPRHNNMLMAVNALLIWCNVLVMLEPFEYFGVLTIIMFKILFTDIIRFFAVFSLMLLGFTSSFTILFIKQTDVEIGYAYPFRDLPIALYHAFLMTIGEMGDDEIWGSGEQGPFSNTSYHTPLLAVALAVSFVVLCGILSVNLLIAMMSDTYTNIIVNARKEHVFPFARTVLFMEKVTQGLLPTWITADWRYGKPTIPTVCKGDERWDNPDKRKHQEYCLTETKDAHILDSLEVEDELGFKKTVLKRLAEIHALSNELDEQMDEEKDQRDEIEQTESEQAGPGTSSMVGMGGGIAEDHAPVAQQTYYTSRDSHGRVTHGTLRMRQRNMNTKMANMNTKMARMNSEVAHSNGHRLTALEDKLNSALAGISAQLSRIEGGGGRHQGAVVELVT